MKKAIKVLESAIAENSKEMKILAFEYIRNEGNANTRYKFLELEQRNIALEQAIDRLLEMED